MTALFLISAALYGLSALLYGVFLARRDQGSVRLARLALLAAVLTHLAMIGLLCTRHLNPLRDLRGALSFIAWLAAMGFIAATHRDRMSVLGAFVAPFSLALLVLSRLTPQDLPAGGAVAGTTRALGNLHIALSALGVAAFGLAAAVSVIYLMQEQALKKKRLGPLFRVAPPLTSLDTMGRRLILFGFPVYTLAVATGMVWMHRLSLHQGLRIDHVIAVGTWLIFAALIGLRVTVGLRGRRAALITVLGFAAMVTVLLIYTLRRMWGA